MKKSKEVMTWPRLFYRLGLICLVMIVSLGIFNRGAAVLIPYLITLIAIVLLRKKDYALALAISTLLGFMWVYFGRNLYLYSNQTFVIGGINFFTLIAFSLGLLCAFIIYQQFLMKLKYKKFHQQFVLFTGLYWVFLIIFEWMGYHVFGIQNAAASEYPGIPFFNCLHAPRFMQVAYFSFGPIFFTLYSFLYSRLRIPFVTRLGKSLSISQK